MKLQDLRPLRPGESRVLYETPDGTNIIGKAYYYSKISGVIGAVIATADITTISLVTGARKVLLRYGTWCLPAVALGATFGAVTGIAGNIRGKDGPLNHLIGGLAGGSVIGAKVKCPKTGIGYGAALGLSMALLKWCKVNDVEIFPTSYKTWEYPRGEVWQIGRRPMYGPDGPIKP